LARVAFLAEGALKGGCGGAGGVGTRDRRLVGTLRSQYKRLMLGEERQTGAMFADMSGCGVVVSRLWTGETAKKTR
jgi:hypothetical protein